MAGQRPTIQRAAPERTPPTSTGAAKLKSVTHLRTLTFLLFALAQLSAQNALVSTATERYFNVVRRNLEASADAMPTDKFSFRLTDGQMTFAEWLIGRKSTSPRR